MDHGAKNPRETTAEQRLTVDRSFLAEVPKNIYEKTVKSALPALSPQTVAVGASNARARHSDDDNNNNIIIVRRFA